MYLTTENAHEYEGKKLYGGAFHYWPMTVSLHNGTWFATDRNGASVPVPDPGDRFNALCFSRAE